MNKGEKIYDLEERTAKLAEDIIVFCKRIKQDVISKPMTSQLVRSGTSVGANYCETNGASSRKDFKNKIHICKKEAQETKYWVRMIVKYDRNLRDEALRLWQETQELTLIFGKIISSLKN